MNGFQEEDAVFGQTIAHADQWIRHDQWTELRFPAADLRLQVQPHAGFTLKNDIQAVRGTPLPKRCGRLELDGDPRFFFCELLPGAQIERNTLPARNAREDLECRVRVRP